MKTAERNLEIYNDIKNGDSIINVAKKYGISRQRVYQICERKEMIDGGEETSYKTSARRVIYPAIKKWMLDNRVPMTQFDEIIRNMGGYGLSVRRFLYGESPGNIDLIKKILNVTNMKFEDAFYTENSETDSFEEK